MSVALLKGVIHGKTIELEQESELPDGQRVSVQVEPEEVPPKYLERFTVDPLIALGKLIVKDTRLPVEDLTRLVEEGRSDEEMLRRHPELTVADVDAVRQYAKVPEGLRRSFGGWAEDAEELDKYLNWTRQHRKLGRPGDRGMSFLLDTDICSAQVKGNVAVHSRFIQYGGRLNISTVTLGELWTWAKRAKTSPRRQQALIDLLKQVQIFPVDETIAEKFGEVRAWQLDHGLSTPDLDLLNSATVLVHGFTLVTHNTADYANVPSLKIADWLVP